MKSKENDQIYFDLLSLARKGKRSLKEFFFLKVHITLQSAIQGHR